MTIIHMRKPLLSLRTYSNALSSNRYLIPASSPVCRSIFTSPPHSFAQVRSERLLPTELWFTRSFPRRGPEECDRGTEDSKDNERTLKLGKSTSPLSLALHAQPNSHQPFGSSKPVYLLSSPPHFLLKFFRRKSSSTSSPPLTPTSPPSQAVSLTTQPSGPPLSHGAVFPSSVMSN